MLLHLGEPGKRRLDSPRDKLDNQKDKLDNT
jgi:hypothetical protein